VEYVGKRKGREIEETKKTGYGGGKPTGKGPPGYPGVRGRNSDQSVDPSISPSLGEGELIVGTQPTGKEEKRKRKGTYPRDPHSSSLFSLYLQLYPFRGSFLKRGKKKQRFYEVLKGGNPLITGAAERTPFSKSIKLPLSLHNKRRELERGCSFRGREVIWYDEWEAKTLSNEGEGKKTPENRLKEKRTTW